MKFTLCMTADNISKELSKEYEKYGFKFKEEKNKYFPKNCMIISSNPTIEFDTIEDLVNFSIEINEELILNGTNLEIYNSHME